MGADSWLLPLVIFLKKLSGGLKKLKSRGLGVLYPRSYTYFASRIKAGFLRWPTEKIYAALKKRWHNILGILCSTAVGVVLMVWLYRGFDFRQIQDLFLLRSNYLWILSTLAAGIVANVLRALRWQMLLKSTGISVSRRHAVELVFISYLINSVTPRLGELTRSVLVGRGRVSVSTRAIGTVVVEKLADVGCLLLVVVAAVALHWENTSELASSLGRQLAFMFPPYTLYIIIGGGFIAILLGVLLRHRVRSFFCHLWQGFSAIARLDSPLRFGYLCLGIWFCNFMQLYLLVPCFDSLAQLSLADTFYLFAAASIGVLIPTPGGAGPWHFVIVKTLTGVFHIGEAVAKSFALVTHGLKTVLVMLLGLLAYLTYYGEIAARLRRKAQTRKDRKTDFVNT